MKKPKAPRLVTVTILTTITIIFWVFTGLYNIITSNPPTDVDPEILEPINPALDQEALNRLEARINFEEGQTTSPIIINEIPQPVPEIEEPIIIPEEELSAESTPTPIISQ